ncbi:hypothetical protein FXO38_34638 [Capsicum annuum]|nr:hypothetical protein FXO38_34638 [Capsicum annuum]
MAALCILRLPQIRPLKILRCFSSSASVEDLSPALESSPTLFLENNKWKPFIKKKVVMRVGYVGSDYRGLQMQRDEHELSSARRYNLFRFVHTHADKAVCVHMSGEREMQQTSYYLLVISPKTLSLKISSKFEEVILLPCICVFDAYRAVSASLKAASLGRLSPLSLNSLPLWMVSAVGKSDNNKIPMTNFYTNLLESDEPIKKTSSLCLLLGSGSRVWAGFGVGVGLGLGLGSSLGLGARSSKVRWDKGASRLRVGFWNLWTLQGKSTELVKILRKRRICIAYVQETKWVGSKVKDVDAISCGTRVALGRGVEEELWEILDKVVRGVSSTEKPLLEGISLGILGLYQEGIWVVGSEFELSEEGGAPYYLSLFGGQDSDRLFLLRKGDRALCKNGKVIPSENLSTLMDLVVKKGRKKRGVEDRPRKCEVGNGYDEPKVRHDEAILNVDDEQLKKGLNSSYDLERIMRDLSKEELDQSVNLFHIRFNMIDRVTKQVVVNFGIDKYRDEVLCDVLPLQSCHMLFGRPCLVDKDIRYQVESDKYLYLEDESTLVPLTPYQESEDCKIMRELREELKREELEKEEKELT